MSKIMQTDKGNSGVHPQSLPDLADGGQAISTATAGEQPFRLAFGLETVQDIQG